MDIVKEFKLSGSSVADQDRRNKTYRQLKNLMIAILFLAPTLALLTVFVLVPSIMAFALAFWNYKLMGMNTTWAGWTNFVDALKLNVFQLSLKNTAFYAVMMVPSIVILSVAIALLIHRISKFYVVIRTLVLLPYATPAVGTAIGWMWIFNPNYGIANGILRWLGLPTSQWLHSPVMALPSIAIYSLWHALGFNVIIVMSAIAGLPKGILEAASIDGASAGRRFWKVTLPLISPTIFFIVMVTTIEALQSFGQVFALSGGTGGPEYATTTTLFLIYQTAFKYNDFSFASAMAVILVLIIIAFTLVQRWIGKWFVFYQ